MGCANIPPAPYAIAPGYEGAASIDEVLLVPLNLTVSLPAEFEESTGPVLEMVSAYLQESGKSVNSMRLHQARNLNEESVILPFGSTRTPGTRD